MWQLYQHALFLWVFLVETISYWAFFIGSYRTVFHTLKVKIVRLVYILVLIFLVWLYYIHDAFHGLSLNCQLSNLSTLSLTLFPLLCNIITLQSQLSNNVQALFIHVSIWCRFQEVTQRFIPGYLLRIFYLMLAAEL